jgi:hypothetical protein
LKGRPRWVVGGGGELVFCCGDGDNDEDDDDDDDDDEDDDENDDEDEDDEDDVGRGAIRRMASLARRSNATSALKFKPGVGEALRSWQNSNKTRSR